MFREIPLPTQIENNPQAVEVLRVWLSDGKLDCAVNTTHWSDPAMFGLVLADTLDIIGKEFSKQWNLRPSEAKAKILQLVKEKAENYENA